MRKPLPIPVCGTTPPPPATPATPATSVPPATPATLPPVRQLPPRASAEGLRRFVAARAASAPTAPRSRGAARTAGGRLSTAHHKRRGQAADLAVQPKHHVPAELQGWPLFSSLLALTGQTLLECGGLGDCWYLSVLHCLPALLPALTAHQAKSPLSAPHALTEADLISPMALRAALAMRLRLMNLPSDVTAHAVAEAKLAQPDLTFSDLDGYINAMCLLRLYAGELEICALTRFCPGLRVQVVCLVQPTAANRLSSPTLTTATFCGGQLGSSDCSEFVSTITLACFGHHYKAVVALPIAHCDSSTVPAVPTTASLASSPPPITTSQKRALASSRKKVSPPVERVAMTAPTTLPATGSSSTPTLVPAVKKRAQVAPLGELLPRVERDSGSNASDVDGESTEDNDGTDANDDDGSNSDGNDGNNSDGDNGDDGNDGNNGDNGDYGNDGGDGDDGNDEQTGRGSREPLVWTHDRLTAVLYLLLDTQFGFVASTVSSVRGIMHHVHQLFEHGMVISYHSFSLNVAPVPPGTKPPSAHKLTSKISLIRKNWLAEEKAHQQQKRTGSAPQGSLRDELCRELFFREVSRGPSSVAAQQRETANTFLGSLFEAAITTPSVGKVGAFDAAVAAGASTAASIGPVAIRVKLDASNGEPEQTALNSTVTPRRGKRNSQQAALMEYFEKRQAQEDRRMEFLFARFGTLAPTPPPAPLPKVSPPPTAPALFTLAGLSTETAESDSISSLCEPTALDEPSALSGVLNAILARLDKFSSRLAAVEERDA